VQVDECFLEALLHDILGVLSRAGHAPRREEDLSRVTFGQNFKRQTILVLRGSDESHVSFVGKAVGKSNRSFSFADVGYEFGRHSSVLSWFHLSHLCWSKCLM
jgi:hypothetical protein